MDALSLTGRKGIILSNEIKYCIFLYHTNNKSNNYRSCYVLYFSIHNCRLLPPKHQWNLYKDQSPSFHIFLLFLWAKMYTLQEICGDLVGLAWLSWPFLFRGPLCGASCRINTPLSAPSTQRSALHNRCGAAEPGDPFDPSAGPAMTPEPAFHSTGEGTLQLPNYSTRAGCVFYHSDYVF